MQSSFFRFLIRAFLLTIVTVLLLSCNGGGKKDNGGGGAGSVNVKSIILNPATPGASALVQIIADAVSTSTPIGERTKVFSVTGGTLYETEPDFSLVIRGTAAASEQRTISTKNNRVYWITPAETGEVTIKVTIDEASRERKINIGNALASLSVTEDDQGHKIATITANNVTDLFQAAFRINYQSSKYSVVSVEKGDFLGSDALFIGEKDNVPAGVVAVSISKKRDQSGDNGSGVLAKVTFAEKTTSEVRDTSASAAFAIDYIMLLNSQGIELGTGD
jgi:hypothetical protein